MKSLLQLRNNKLEFLPILGRDFCCKAIRKGPSVLVNSVLICLVCLGLKRFIREFSLNLF